MTMWNPSLEDEIPRYAALADAIARDVNRGVLKPGDRLPTHRELAKALGTTVGTVSRGYAEAERRGLTAGEVGRGTFVREPASSFDPWPEATPAEPGLVDLSLSLPVSLREEGELLRRTLGQIAADPAVAAGLLSYRPETATPRQLRAAADRLARLGLQIPAEDLLVTAGSQHALNVVLASLFRPGQVLLTAELTYPSIKAQARAFGVRLRGVELDEGGVVPEAVERACRQEPRPAGLYLVPTIQNPTGATLSPERRKALAELARKHDLWIVEDDVHAFLPEKPSLPVAVHAPERTVYLSSVAKCLAPGLRTGFIAGPRSVRERLLAGIHTSLWMPAPLMGEVTTRWLADGTADDLVAAKRRETRERQRLVSEMLDGFRFRADPEGYQVWLELPEPWCSDEIVARARERGVVVIGAGAFAVGRSNVPHALRLSIGVPSRSELERGLRILAELLDGAAAPAY